MVNKNASRCSLFFLSDIMCWPKQCALSSPRLNDFQHPHSQIFLFNWASRCCNVFFFLWYDRNFLFLFVFAVDERVFLYHCTQRHVYRYMLQTIFIIIFFQIDLKWFEKLTNKCLVLSSFALMTSFELHKLHRFVKPDVLKHVLKWSKEHQGASAFYCLYK